jgi:hypothetical protein
MGTERDAPLGGPVCGVLPTTTSGSGGGGRGGRGGGGDRTPRRAGQGGGRAQGGGASHATRQPRPRPLLVVASVSAEGRGQPVHPAGAAHQERAAQRHLFNTRTPRRRTRERAYTTRTGRREWEEGEKCLHGAWRSLAVWVLDSWSLGFARKEEKRGRRRRTQSKATSTTPSVAASAQHLPPE